MSEQEHNPQQPAGPDPGGNRRAGGSDDDRGATTGAAPEHAPGYGVPAAHPGPSPEPAAGVPAPDGPVPSEPPAPGGPGEPGGPAAVPPGQPVPGHPGPDQPAGAQPRWDQPAGGQPRWDQPTVAQPGWERPAAAQPGWERPAATRPGWDQPTGPQPGWEQPAWAPAAAPTPRSRGHAGRNLLAVVGVLALMAISAVGGGVAGALVYAQSDIGEPGAEATRVVDGPQLDYTSLASIASSVSPSVVSIQIGQAGGSGVVMSDDGYIITNAHVVEAAPGSDVRVRFSNGEVAQASVVGSDQRSDIAVIQVDGVSGLTPATFGASSEVLVGDTVLALGSPLGFDGSVTQGIISALDRTLQPAQSGAPPLSGLLQTDAAINRGNSGGALVNLSGEVVGINTAIAVQNQEDGFLGVGFAVPSDRVTSVAEQLIAGEEVGHAFLGVRVATAEGGGALVGEVSPGSPAEEAGLQEDDVIVRLGDRPITDRNDLVSAVQSARVGDTLEIEFERDGASQTSEVTLTDASD